MTIINKNILNLFLITIVIAFFSLSFLNEADSATITIVNGDSPGEGLNDPTPFGGAPGNPATTVGQARINSFNYAAQILGDALVSDIEIEVLARFDSLFCSPFSATLGQAGPRTGHINFTNAPIPNTVYPQALANSYAGFDLSVLEDIQATFNSELDGSLSCLGGNEWYYGTDANPPGGDIDFVTTAIHEIIHGLGFSSNILSSGAFFNGNVAVYDRFLVNSSLTPLDTASQSTRQAAILSGNGLLWNGPSVNSIVSQKTNGTRSISGNEYIQMYAPNPHESGSSTSHYDTEVSPDEIMEPILVVDEHDLTFSLALLEDIGWFLDSSPPPPPPPPGGTGPFMESGGLVVMEAENFDENNAGSTDTWSSNSSSGASGGTYMQSIPNDGSNFNTGYAANSPELMYLVDFINTGTYYVWVRACGTNNSNDSLHAGINGLENSTANRIKAASSCSSFQWTKARMGGAPDASVNVGTAGVHEINIWMREDGSRVDKILLTTDSAFTPAGEGPAESPRGS